MCVLRYSNAFLSHKLFLLRHAGVVEASVNRFFYDVSNAEDTERRAAELSHDLSLLRLVETFSESSPQLVLMLTLILQRGELDHMTGMLCYSFL